MYLHIALMHRHVFKCGHLHLIDEIFSLHMEDICTNMNTRINARSEMCVGQRVDLNADVDVEVWSSLLAAMFILMLISVVRRIFQKKKTVAFSSCGFLLCSRNAAPKVSFHRVSQSEQCTFHDVSLFFLTTSFNGKF